jgi:hypothetical protein
MMSIFGHFWKREKIKSIDQLRQDFGDFPPMLLAGAKVSFEYERVVTTRLGYRLLLILFAIQIFFRIRKSSEVNSSDSPYDSYGLVDVTVKFANALSSCKRDFKGLSVIPKAIIGLILVVLMPMVFLCVIVGVVGVAFKKAIPKGEYFPFIEKIAVVENSVDSDSELDSVISHEHIHYLQAMYRSELPPVSRDVSDPARYLTELHRESSHALYLLRSVEVEARLHELVLSYYRAFKTLPTTYEQFLEMLHGCETLTNTLKETYSVCNLQVLINDDVIFTPRQAGIIEDIAIAIRCFSKFDDELRFIHQVLPVMYANLLLYYGDKKLSNEFRGKIPDTKFYYELYEVNFEKSGKQFG